MMFSRRHSHVGELPMRFCKARESHGKKPAAINDLQAWRSPSTMNACDLLLALVPSYHLRLGCAPMTTARPLSQQFVPQKFFSLPQLRSSGVARRAGSSLPESEPACARQSKRRKFRRKQAWQIFFVYALRANTRSGCATPNRLMCGKQARHVSVPIQGKLRRVRNCTETKTDVAIFLRHFASKSPRFRQALKFRWISPVR